MISHFSTSSFPGARFMMLQVTVEHITDFFVKHAINNNLGQIANAWLIHADMKGAGCQECLDLAQLHSRAVDFPKTGEWHSR
jgi:RNA-dependent RNA polymerase